MSLPDFIDARLSDCVSYGFEVGPVRPALIKTQRNRHERRRPLGDRALHRCIAPFNRVKPEVYEELKAVHMVCHGPVIAFRFKDWADFKVVDGTLGVGTGAPQVLQLVKRYEFGNYAYKRELTLLAPGTTAVRAGGVAISADVDEYTGQVALTAPAGAVITFDTEFDMRVRFVNEYLPATYKRFRALSVSVELVEVFR